MYTKNWRQNDRFVQLCWFCELFFFCRLQRHVLSITVPVLDIFELFYRFSGENESCCRVKKEDTVLPSKDEALSRKDFMIIMVNLVICWLVIKLLNGLIGLKPILFVIQPVTIYAMLNKNDPF